MSDKNRCPECGAPRPPHAPQGHCPGCLLKRGLESSPSPSEAAGQASGAFAPPTPAQLAAQFPDLEILEFIGRGGMGMVYKARQKHLDRPVALKILVPNIAQDPAFAERFVREARAMAMLSHPHIVTVHDFGQTNLPSPSGRGAGSEGGLYYFLMEFVDGLTLRQLLDAGKVAPPEALAIVPQICEALQYAHDKGVVHRDVKPENILMDRSGQVKIADFGLAKLVGPEAKDFSLTGAGQVMGTPHYMAPEQTEHPQEVDHRADIYSLGVVFYQMLTGELPIGRFAPPSRKVQIDVRLDEVVLRALEKEPDLRYQQAGDVKTMIEMISSTPVHSGARVPPIADARAGESWQSPTSGWGWLIGKIFGTTFTSPIAYKCAHLSALGFLGSLGFLGNVPLPGWQWCSHFFGLYGLFGLIGLAIMVELIARAKAKAAKAAKANPLPMLQFWEALEDEDYARAWEKTSAYFQQDVGKHEWLARMEKLRRPLGKTTKCEILSPNWLNPGVRCEAKYRKTFADGSTAIETVIFAQQTDGEWRVESYRLDPITADAGQSPQVPSAGEDRAGSFHPVEKRDWTLWSPGQSPLVRDICAHMTETEKREAGKRGLMFGLWNAMTFFGPFFCVMFVPGPLGWVLGIAALVIGLSFYPLWRKMERDFLCSTAWARQQGVTPEQLKRFADSSQPAGAKQKTGNLPLFVVHDGQRHLYWPGVLLFCGTLGLGVLGANLAIALALWLLNAPARLTFQPGELLLVLMLLAACAVMRMAALKLGSSEPARAASAPAAKVGTARKVILAFLVFAVALIVAGGVTNLIYWLRALPTAATTGGNSPTGTAGAAPEITRVVVSRDQAVITGRSPDAGMFIMIGALANSDVWIAPHNGSPFTVTLTPQWFWRGGYDWVVRASYGNIPYRLDSKTGPLSGRIVFREGTPAPDADGSYVIGEFQSETGKALPIKVRLETESKQNARPTAAPAPADNPTPK